MKQFLRGLLLFLCYPVLTFGQSIFSNPINGVNPNVSSPYTIGQFVDSNITVSGIGRGSGIFGINANNRYDARSWKSDALDSNTYFEFSLTPNAGKRIDFISFVYSGQISVNGPSLFAFRSSVDGFASDIGMVTATGTTVSLAAPVFQNITSPITFRFYGWAANTGTGTFSINDFEFDGVVSCAAPQIPVLPETNSSCSSMSFVLNWPISLDASNYFIDVATDGSFINTLVGDQNKELGNVLSESVTGLIAGKIYYVRLRSGNNCSLSDYSNILKVAPPETVFNGTWSNGIPDATKDVRFSSAFNVTGTLEACSCQIDGGIAVHVDSGAILKLENSLEVIGNGTLVFEDGASLIQYNDNAVNSGTISYRRISAPMKNFDFTYWSSPVTGQTAKLLSPNTLADKYFRFDGAGNKWVFDNGLMNPGVGFIIRVPKPNSVYSNLKDNWTTPTYAQPVVFDGIPNNGNYSFAVGAGQNNLIGNPYPSAIDADLFLTNAINSGLVSGALYFWTHNTAITPSGSFYVYNSNDYATYNLTGGAGTATGAAATGGAPPSGKIAAGQSFFVGSKNAGSFEFNNSMRVSASGSNSQFFKMANTKKTAKIEKNRVWLNLANADGAFKQLLVGYITGATNDLDNLYDGASFDGNSYVDFYSVNNAKNLTIQGRALPFDANDQVPLGYKTTINGTFTISVDNTDGVLATQTVYLEDKLTNVLHNLKDGAYSFTTVKGEFKDRFVLRYTDGTKLGTVDHTADGQSVIVSVKNHKIKINSFDQTIASVLIYDLKGSLLYEKKNVNKNEFSIENLASSDQFLIVLTQLTDDKWVTKEIIFHE
jgi:hypothetical protein